MTDRRKTGEGAMKGWETRRRNELLFDKRYKRLLTAFAELQAAAQKVVDETDRTYDSDPWPIKYRAPYGAITALRRLLLKNYGIKSP
jgi:hypothetical protein